MIKLNFQKTTFKPWKLSKSDSCFSNCATEIKGLLWISNQPFWTYQCLCCKVYQFERGKVNFEWGGTYD